MQYHRAPRTLPSRAANCPLFVAHSPTPASLSLFALRNLNRRASENFAFRCAWTQCDDHALTARSGRCITPSFFSSFSQPGPMPRSILCGSVRRLLHRLHIHGCHSSMLLGTELYTKPYHSLLNKSNCFLNMSSEYASGTDIKLLVSIVHTKVNFLCVP